MEEALEFESTDNRGWVEQDVVIVLDKGDGER